jgi:pimeloyl-[acyl-carrier protein] synthase
MSASAAPDVNLSTLPPLGDGLLVEINRLRDHDPLYWSEASRCWIVTGHAEITEGFSGRLPLSSHHIPESLYRVIPPEEFARRLPNTLRYKSQILPNLDGAPHARIRKLLVKALSKKVVEDMRPYVQQRVAMLLDKAAKQRELEFNENIARPLAGAVILRLLGLPDSYLEERLKRWTDAVTRALTSFNPKPEWLDNLELAVTDMNVAFRQEIEACRANPRANLTTEMVNAVDGGDRLSMDEMLASMNLVIVAGHDTTLNSMALGIRAMSKHPDKWAEWRAHPERSVDAAIELMRYVAMATALPRIVSEAFDWHGRHLRQYDLVMLMMAGGNRDPKVYSRPNEMDFARANDTALTFGPGLHHCIGHLLAKMQISEFFTALTQRFDRVEILKEPEFVPNLVFRGVARLDVRFHPRA